MFAAAKQNTTNMKCITKICTMRLPLLAQLQLKSTAFEGYHHATYTADMNMRYLLFLKSIGIGNMEARELTYYDEKGQGETGNFDQEMELLLFDM